MPNVRNVINFMASAHAKHKNEQKSNNIGERARWGRRQKRGRAENGQGSWYIFG